MVRASTAGRMPFSQRTRTLNRKAAVAHHLGSISSRLVEGVICVSIGKGQGCAAAARLR